MRAKVSNPGIGMTSKPRNLLSDWILIKHDQTFYLQDANLPGFLVVAVLAGLDLSLQVAQPVGEQLFVQLVVVPLLTRDHQLFLLTGDLKRETGSVRLRFSTRSSSSRPPLPPVSSDSHDAGPVRSEHGCHGAVLPVCPCVPSLAAPPSEPGELAGPLSRTRTETHADSREQEEQRQKKKQNLNQ